MKRRHFVKAAGALALLSSAKAYASPAPVSSQGKEIYEWRIYTLNQETDTLDRFYQDTLIPAYNRKQIKVAAFAPYKPGEKVMRYFLFIYPDMGTYQQVKQSIRQDQTFCRQAQAFYDQTAVSPIYSNLETYLCEAFDKIPTHRLPDPTRSLFEIRIYWSPNEEANQRKVGMFNREEIDLFDKVGIHSVCYGDILAGPRMPALIYLTWYKDEPTRAEAWKKFASHPDWLAMKDRPEYAHTATNNQSIFLTPLAYSQL
ncbi:NIPSNAP family protein [Parabacteroides sp. PF5-6]|uniref:NIPSNAP family protein n=1 Tax=Parabacteroides sp. PF5-6 TaxID=1742403 RepID=UPI002406DAA4|nr:NIPSNAP family protein [Parabacteroides sp. PF5-6]MDF9831491.1 hypothetical protein [Parabacteroides sp. PF5-6]